MFLFRLFFIQRISAIFFLTSAFSLHAQEDSVTDPLKNLVFSKNDEVISKGKTVSSLKPGDTTTLPIGITKDIGVTRYVITLDSSRYYSREAFINAYAAIEFPSSGKRMAFAAFGVPFNPAGVMAKQARLMLVSEHIINLSPTLRLRLPADGSNFVEWDCSGFKAISLKGYFEFSPNILVPDSTQTNDKYVSGSFQIYTSDIHNFITQINIAPFCIRGLKDWSFTVKDATVDFSEIANAPGLIFPPDYRNTTPLWTGFYLREVSVKIPPEISSSGKRSEVSAQHLLIDNMGVSGIIKAVNLLRMGEVTMSGWDFSVEELGVSFLCNKLNGGHLKGGMSIPAFDSSQAIAYSATILYNPNRQDADYLFSINPRSDLSFNLLSAKVDLYPSSRIHVSKINGMFLPYAILNGKIAFQNEKFSTAKLDFQEVLLTTDKPYLKGGIFSCASGKDQSRLSGFPVCINGITLGIHDNSPAAAIDVSLNLMDEKDMGFSTGTKILVSGKIQEEKINIPGDIPRTVTKTKWKLDKIKIGTIWLNSSTTLYTLKGMAAFMENDPVYGNGFRGQISLAIPPAIKDTIIVTAWFGHKDFRYWYVDFRVPVNIPLGAAPVTLKNLSGGMYYRMMPQLQRPEEYMQILSKPAPVNAAVQRYVPDQKTSLGFKAGTAYQYAPSEKALNGDVMLEIAFNENGGLGFIKLEGSACMMSTVEERKINPPPVSGKALIQYDAQNRVFDASLSLLVNAYNAIAGAGYGKIHIDPDVWFVCAGKPGNSISVGIRDLASANAYFMVGNSLEPMAPPPPQVASIVKSHGLENRRDNEALAKAGGFCAGVRFHSSFYKSFGWKFFSVYGGFAYGAGFDMMLLNYGPRAHCSGSSEIAGINGQIASGQLYIYLQGNIGITGHLKFAPGCNICLIDTDFDISILSGTVAAIVGGKLPNPSYAYGTIACSYSILGKINGSFDFNYELGKDCAIVSN